MYIKYVPSNLPPKIENRQLVNQIIYYELHNKINAAISYINEIDLLVSKEE